MEDKYIGLVLAILSSLAIGSSFIFTKKGLNAAAERSEYGAKASDNRAYLRNPIWWAGMVIYVTGEAANFAAYTFAPPILVTPLGALSVLIGSVLASFLLDEELGHIGCIGCALCLVGSLIIVIHAPEEKPINTVDEILQFAMKPGFLMYSFSVVVFTLYMIAVVVPKYGRTNPLVYVSICSLVGSISVMAIKGFGIAVKLTFAGNNQFTHISTYFFGAVVVLCILIQMDYLNKALDTFSTNVINPMYYVGFSSATIVASLILFQGFNTTDLTNTLSLLVGFIVTFLGIHLLNTTPPALNKDEQHFLLETVITTPRTSSQAWNPSRTRTGIPIRPTTLFNAEQEHLDPPPSGSGTGSAPNHTKGHHRHNTSVPSSEDSQHSKEDEESDDDEVGFDEAGVEASLLKQKKGKSAVLSHS